jgi:hypothetical protein
VKVGDIEVRHVAGSLIEVSIPTDTIPARALLDRGEAFMLADMVRNAARRVEVT